MPDPKRGGAAAAAPSVSHDAASDLVPQDEEEAQDPAPPTGGERGTPSAQLQQSGMITPGQPAEGGGEYEGITDAAPEQGVYHIVGGYLDEQGVVHTEVHLRSMDGEDEDLLGNRGVPITDRLNTILKHCTKRIGTIIEPGQIGLAIDRLPSGSRTHLLICLRRITHWKRTKDFYDMEMRCPYAGCQQKHSYAVNLAELETFDMPHPDKREHTVRLEDAALDAVWRIASTAQEKILNLITGKDDAAVLTYSIMLRLVSLGEEDVRLTATDLLSTDHKKLRFSNRAQALYQRVRKMSVGDREAIRESMLAEEPGIDTEIIFDCKSCNREFDGTLNIAQEGFWFPSVASRRSKMRSST